MLLIFRQALFARAVAWDAIRAVAFRLGANYPNDTAWQLVSADAKDSRLDDVARRR
jgi:hypothetical protein